MRKLTLLIGLLPCLASFGQGYKVYKSDGKVDAYSGETAVSVSLNDDSLRYVGHEYVDLGLPSGTRWATANVGATNGNQNGLHFTFALAKTDGQWGGDWRMPGIPEFQELLRVCQWEWTKEGISQGYMVTGLNGNKLFLPAAGYIKPDGSFAGGLTGQLAGYWTSEGYSLSFSASGKGLSPNGNALQLSVRPVIGGKVQPDNRSEVVSEGQHEYVDLGLSVFWATTNIGADTPEAFGDYFAPGCPVPMSLENYPFQSQYMYENYYQNGREEEFQAWLQQSRQCLSSYENGYWILPEHDIATLLWGDGWRTPTLSEINELKQMSSYSRNTFRGTNGNTIYFPRAGYYSNDNYNSDYSYYMTSSISYYGYPMSSDLSTRSVNYFNDINSRSFYPIRPVKDKPKNGLTDEKTKVQQEMVDLGLSVLWANSNWGAATPQDKGEYAAFLETYPKAEYTPGNHHPASNYSLQSLQSMFGNLRWSLPTTEEVQELLDKCSCAREEGGYRLTGPNGNSIFMPYAGFREGQALNFPDELGLFRTLDGQALQLSADGTCGITEPLAYAGLTIRPVMNPIYPETGDAQTDWHSATITCKARGEYSEFGIQLCFLKEMDNKYSEAWIIPSDSASLQDGKFTAELYLQPNTPCYYRAYAATRDSIPKKLYGDIKLLHTTADIPAVDLGLSVKWAAVNLGAISETDSLYYNYYPNRTDTGKLPAIYDGVNSNLTPASTWGEGWQIPTEAEFRELMDRCTWEWTFNGYKVTGPNGNSIFLPAGTLAYGYQGGYGSYWTQTPSEKHAGCNSIFKLTDTDRKISFGPTTNVYNIRPVKK